MASQTASFILTNYDSKASTALMGLAVLHDQLSANADSKRTMQYDLISSNFVTFISAGIKRCAPLISVYTTQQSLGSAPTWGGEAVFELKQVGHFWSDMAINITIAPIGDAAAPAVGSTLYNYCNFPGIRILDNVDFRVDNYPIDSYGSDEAFIHRDMYVPEPKRAAWDRSLGQEQPREGYLYYRDFNVRELKNIYDGPQTPAPYQPALDLWIPLLFWFNTEADNPLCIGDNSVPFGQRIISARLATADRIIQQSITLPNGIRGGYSLVPQPPAIIGCTLHTNNLFMDPAVFDAFISQISYTIARVHIKRITQSNTSIMQFQLNEFKYPTENFIIGFKPVSNALDLQNWYQYSIITSTPIPVVVSAYYTGKVVPSIIREMVNYTALKPVIDKLQLTAGGGIILMADHTPVFYNSYIPATKNCISVSPSNAGLYIIPFNYQSLNRQPSGFLDLTKIKTVELKVISSYVSPNTPVDCIITARAINFLGIGKTNGLVFVF